MKRILLFGAILGLLKAVDVAAGHAGTEITSTAVGLAGLIGLVVLVVLVTDPFLNNP